MGVQPPPAKKVKLNDGTGAAVATAVQPDGLIPEQQFLEQSGGGGKEYKIRVKVPRDDNKKEFQFKGQTLTFTMKLGAKVEVLKQRIHSVLTMPINKMKLRIQNGPHLKDGASLA